MHCTPTAAESAAVSALYVCFMQLFFCAVCRVQEAYWVTLPSCTSDVTLNFSHQYDSRLGCNPSDVWPVLTQFCAILPILAAIQGPCCVPHTV